MSPSRTYPRALLVHVAFSAVAILAWPSSELQAQVPSETLNLSWCSGSKDCLQWSSTSGATQYRLYRGEQSSVACLANVPLDSCLAGIWIAATTGTASIPEVPASGRFYWYVVTPENSSGEGPSGKARFGSTTPHRVRNTFGSCPGSCSPSSAVCAAASDCCSSNCFGGSCQTGCCAPAGSFCNLSSDCCTGNCVASVCQPCIALGGACATSSSCCTGNCQSNVCVASCAPNGGTCAANVDCCSGTCASGTCQPCVPTGGTCTLASQCCSSVCSGGSCSAPSCFDGVKNGSETGVDCGGGSCPSCANGQPCAAGSDCVSGNCTSGVCQCVGTGGACTTTSQCCGGLCVGNLCTSVPICGDGVVAGTEACDDGNTANNDGCSATCTVETGYVCAGSPSACTPCPAGFANCNGLSGDGCEVDLTTSAPNCGACGNACVLPNANAACSGGTCQVGSCLPGYGDCNGNPTDGCEVYLPADPSNCGACGNACTLPNATGACVNGTCQLGSCLPGYFDCNGLPADGCETYVLADPSNCGGCGNVCTFPNATGACLNGACQVGSCLPGYGNCNGSPADGCEVNTSTSTSNCGACGSVCPIVANSTPVCSASTCNLVCTAGWANCNGSYGDGCERNIYIDANNCGGCGMVCSTNNMATRTCSAPGVCNGTCTAGFADCNGNKQTDGCEVNLNTNSQNCGLCGRVCAIGTFCVSGSCQAP